MEPIRLKPEATYGFFISTERLSNPHAALLAHELLDVVRPAGATAGRAARLPAAKRVDAGPRAGRRPGAAVRIGDARLDSIEELLNLAIVFGENPGRQA